MCVYECECIKGRHARLIVAEPAWARLQGTGTVWGRANAVSSRSLVLRTCLECERREKGRSVGSTQMTKQGFFLFGFLSALLGLG